MPKWSVASRQRRAHIERVAAVMDGWARTLDLPKRDRHRWVAAAILHDALRDAPPDELRDQVDRSERHLPGRVLHGPAAARKLRKAGVDDEAVLLAVGHHTLGHPDLDQLGRALCVADFAEPGRRKLRGLRDRLLHRAPRDLDRSVRKVVELRIANLLDRQYSVPPVTVEFWNRLVQDGGRRMR